jgi:predicted nucleic acid-binding Zn ribbon protein
LSPRSSSANPPQNSSRSTGRNMLGRLMQLDRVLLALMLAVDFSRSQEVRGVDLAKLFKDAEQSVHLGHCVVCKIAQVPQTDSELEEHHIAGKVCGRPNFPDTVTVCGPCHEYLSDHQKDWLVHRRDSAHRLSSYLFGWADIFDLLCQKSGRPRFVTLARRFRSQGWHIRNNVRGR